MSTYGFVKKVPLTVEDAEARLREELGKQGFGVLVRIDLAEKLREKLGVAMEPYVILGACNPPNAHKAVAAEPDIGLLLPCNAVVYRRDGATWVGVIRPTVAMQMVDNSALAEIATAVERKLESAFKAV